MKCLGIDYGKKRVGIAISDDEGVFAFPFVILQNDIELLKNIKNICQKEKIEEIILGESKNLSGHDNKIMKDINKFKKELQSEIEFTIYLEKEFLTTVFAREKIFKQKGNVARKIKKEKDAAADASAAALILQRFLDRKNQK